MILAYQLISKELGHVLRLFIIICICLIIHIFGFRYSYLYRDLYFLRRRNLSRHNMRTACRLRLLWRLLFLFRRRFLSLLYRRLQLMRIGISAFLFDADLTLLKVFPGCRCENLSLGDHIHLRLAASKFIAKEIFRDCSHVLSLLP